MAEIIEATEGKIRDKPINDKLRRLLDKAADAAEIETVLVTSGGQVAKGMPGKRTGSTRHDLGNAADLQLLKEGKALDFTETADRKVVAAFVTAAAANGATGIGAGVEYMGPKTLHVGYGARSVWGAGGKAGNAPAWLKKAVFAGWENPAEDIDILPPEGPIVTDEDEAAGDWRSFVGAAKPLREDDMRLVAGYLGCHLAALKAVIAVESRDEGFGPDGRPIILNEPHVFWRELGAGANRDKAVREGLAYRKWGTKPYPKTQAARYQWLAKAMAIDERAALCSCSWGIGQIMGFNHGICGFADVRRFVQAMMLSEGAQLFAMARFIVSKRIEDNLRERDWSGFARSYNGAGFAKHGYHTKLKNAYEARPESERVIPREISEADLRAILIDDVASDATEPAPPDMPPDVAPGSGERMVVIARDGLNLRSGSSTDFQVLRTLPFGTEVHVLAREDDWALVDLHGDGKADGFMFVSFLRPPGEAPPPVPVKPPDERPTNDQLADLLKKLSDFIDRLRR
jgi:hypothetical protein